MQPTASWKFGALCRAKGGVQATGGSVDGLSEVSIALEALLPMFGMNPLHLPRMLG